jgi:hypothetical protein
MTNLSLIPVIDKDCDVSIFIPGVNQYVEVVGAKMQIIDGKQYLRIVCKTPIGTELLINPSDLEIYFKRYGVPF